MACSGECTRKYYMFHSPAARIKDIKVQQAGAAEQPASNLSNGNQQTIINTIDNACDKLKYPGAPKAPPAAAPVYDNFGLPGRECEKDCVCSRYKEPKRRTEVPNDFSPVLSSRLSLRSAAPSTPSAAALRSKKSNLLSGIVRLTSLPSH